MTLLEGAAAGAAIVASDIPAHREVAGYVPAERTIFVDRDCALAYLGRAVELAARRGRADDTASWRLPSWDGMVDALVQCYAEVIGERWGREVWPSSPQPPSPAAAGEGGQTYSPLPSQRERGWG